MNPLRRLTRAVRRKALERFDEFVKPPTPEHPYFINLSGGGAWYADLIWSDPKTQNLCWAYFDKILNQVVVSQMTAHGVITSYDVSYTLGQLRVRHERHLITWDGWTQDPSLIHPDLN